MRSTFFFLALALILFLPGSASLPLMDRDEPRFAQATWEMIETEQWTIPYFNGDYRFDKPILTYWWMRIHYWIGGKTELAARFHSILSAALTAWVIFRLGSRLFGRRCGIFAGVGFLTCFQTMVHARLCVADMPMILAVTATFDALSRYLLPREDGEKPPGRGNHIYLISALAVGFLAKGPIAWAVPLLACLLFLWPLGRGKIRSRTQQLKTVPWLSSFCLASGIVLLWAAPALWKTKGEFFQVGIGTHVVERGMQSFNGRLFIPGVYYLGTVLVSLLPWSAFLWKALISRRGFADGAEEKRALLLAWFIAPILIFSFYSTQLPHYILPGFPAFFLLLFRDGRLPLPQSKVEKAAFCFTVCVGFFIGIAGTVAVLMSETIKTEPLIHLRGIFLQGIILIFLMTGVAPLIIFSVSRLRNDRTAATQEWIALGIFTLLAAVGVEWISREIRNQHLVYQVTSSLPDEQKNLRLMAYGIGEPSLVFYNKSKDKVRFVQSLDRLPKKAKKKTVVLARTKVWSIPELLKGDSKPAVDKEAEVRESLAPEMGSVIPLEGYNPARSTWERVLLVVPHEK